MGDDSDDHRQHPPLTNSNGHKDPLRTHRLKAMRSPTVPIGHHSLSDNDLDPHTSDATAPHDSSTSKVFQCPATLRVVSTGSVTVADRPLIPLTQTTSLLT